MKINEFDAMSKLNLTECRYAYDESCTVELLFLHISLTCLGSWITPIIHHWIQRRGMEVID
jgi:hypothetical protein